MLRICNLAWCPIREMEETIRYAYPLTALAHRSSRTACNRLEGYTQTLLLWLKHQGHHNRRSHPAGGQHLLLYDILAHS
jgi:hypothetical protein